MQAAIGVSNLQIEEDESFQRREWLMERVGWAGLVVFVLAAAAGAFGGGPLSSTQTSDGGGLLTVHYERFVRFSAVTEFVVRTARTANATETTVFVEQSYLQHFEVASVLPTPVRVEQHGSHVAFVFSSVAGDADHELVFRLKPIRAGRLVGTFGVSKSNGVPVRQFAYF
jgi:hypothetical protein